MKITAQMIVKNEENFVWYAVMSVIDYVDCVKIWDTGSTDNTLRIIEEIKKRKEAKGKVVVKKITTTDFYEGKIRQQMLTEEESDWILALDGDEVWWEDSIKKVVKTIKDEGENLDSIVVPTVNLVGDIFHYQEEKAGKYHFLGKVGHYSLRALNRKIPGLKSVGSHGTWGWIDDRGRMIQERSPSKIRLIKSPYLHLTHLQRSPRKESERSVYKRIGKFKYELGIPFPKDFYYPEVFFRPRPSCVSSPWETMNLSFKFRAFFETPLRKLNRRIMPERIGY